MIIRRRYRRKCALSKLPPLSEAHSTRQRAGCGRKKNVSLPNFFCSFLGNRLVLHREILPTYLVILCAHNSVIGISKRCKIIGITVMPPPGEMGVLESAQAIKQHSIAVTVKSKCSPLAKRRHSVDSKAPLQLCLSYLECYTVICRISLSSAISSVLDGACD